MPAFGKAKSHNWVEADNAFGDFDAIKVFPRPFKQQSDVVDISTQVDSNVPNKRKRNNNNVTKAVATKRRFIPNPTNVHSKSNVRTLWEKFEELFC